MRPITDVLVEFPRAGGAPWLAALPADRSRGDAAGPDPIEAAREAGWAEGFAFGEAEREKQRASTQGDIDREVAAARVHWAATEGAAFADTVRDGLAALQAAIDAAVAAALLPVLMAGLRDRVAGEVADAVGRLLQSGTGGALIELRGPADLLAQLRDAFAGRDAVQVAEADTPELRLTAGDTGATSQIEAWRRRLQASLEAAA